MTSKRIWIAITVLAVGVIVVRELGLRPAGPRGDTRPAAAPAPAPVPAAPAAAPTPAEAASNPARKRGVLPGELLTAMREAFGAAPMAESDGTLRIKSPRCAQAEVETVLGDTGRMRLIGAGYTRFACERKPGDEDVLVLLNAKGLRRRAVAGEIEAERRRQGRPIDEVGVLGSEGEVLYLASDKCSDAFVREVLPGDRPRLLRDQEGFLAIRCDSPSGPGAFVQIPPSSPSVPPATR